MKLVIDASVTIAWIAVDEQSPYADAALNACGNDRAIVPSLWHFEIANSLLILERKGRLTEAATVYAAIIKHFPIDAERDADAEARGADAIEHARRHGLSVYDASYLSLAKSKGVLLATLDKKLATAAAKEKLLFHL